MNGTICLLFNGKTRFYKVYIKACLILKIGVYILLYYCFKCN
nr:MAG TPA: hypothetical protein [Caudoviricetes sp.]